LCGGVVHHIFDSLNLVVSLAGGSTEVRDLGTDCNNRTLLSNSVSTRQVQLGQGTNSGGTTLLYFDLCIFYFATILNEPFLCSLCFPTSLLPNIIGKSPEKICTQAKDLKKYAHNLLKKIKHYCHLLFLHANNSKESKQNK